MSTFPGLSLFFTDVKDADAKDNAAKTPAQDTNAGKNNQEQMNAEGGKTPSASLVPAEKMPAAPEKDAALTTAASALQSAIDKGDAYVNSDKFTQMTAEKKQQLLTAIQTGKELMAKYNAMQAAMNSAALEVDQNNKNKAATKANSNVTALTTLNVNNAPTNTNSDNVKVTTPELTQATTNIMTLLAAPAVDRNLSYDPATKTATISAGEIDFFWDQQGLISTEINDIEHIKIIGPVTVANGKAGQLFAGFPHLQDISGLQNLQTSNITNMDNMFNNDPLLKSIDVSHFDTSKVTSMNGTFNDDPSLTNITGLQNFDTSNVTNMNFMFAEDSSLKSLDLSSFDTRKAVQSNHMIEFIGSSYRLQKIVLGGNTILPPAVIDLPKDFYKNGVSNDKDTITDGKPHAGSWYSYANSIAVNFINVNNNSKISTTQLDGLNATTLNISSTGSDYATAIASNIPSNYHYASSSELKSGESQPITVTFTKETQTIKVYVAGDPRNNVTINFETTAGRHVKTDKPKGQYSNTLDISANSSYMKEAMPAGYTYSSGPSSVTYSNSDQTELILVTANIQSNVKVTYVNAKTGATVGNVYKPTGGTGTKIDLQGGIPDSYHYASELELHGKTQPDANTAKYTVHKQDFTVYVAGDTAATGDEVTVKHYLQGTMTNVPGMDDYPLGGQYGDTVSASGSDSQQTATPGVTRLWTVRHKAES